MFRGLQVFVSGIALAGFTLAGTAVASAQEPAAAPEKPVLTLEGDANIMIVLIKPDKTADFEAVIANGGDTDWVRQAQTRIDALK